MSNLIVYKKSYHMFVKGIEDPIEMSNEGGEILSRMLEDRDCPAFVKVNGGLYNRFEISRLIPYEETVSPARAAALAEYKRIQSLINK